MRPPPVKCGAHPFLTTVSIPRHPGIPAFCAANPHPSGNAALGPGVAPERPIRGPYASHTRGRAPDSSLRAPALGEHLGSPKNLFSGGRVFLLWVAGGRGT